MRTLLVKLGCALGLLILAACAPKLPESMQIAPQVAANPEQVADAPEGKLDKTVLWGGRIIQVKPLEKVTVLEVLHFPAKGFTRPADGDNPSGRFLVEVLGFVEPEVYEPGRQVSVTGRIQTILTQEVGQQAYTYPVVAADNVYLWPEPVEYKGPSYSIGFGTGYYYWDDPYWGRYRW